MTVTLWTNSDQRARFCRDHAERLRRIAGSERDEALRRRLRDIAGELDEVASKIEGRIDDPDISP